MFGAFSVIGFIVGTVGLICCLLARKKVTLITHTPTIVSSEIIKPGFYEVEGTIVCDEPLRLDGWHVKVVWYKYSIDEQVEKRDSNGRYYKTWKTVHAKTGMCPFEVKDRGGTVQVLPQGAEVEGEFNSFGGPDNPVMSETIFGHRASVNRRASIQYLAVDSHIYVLGQVDHHQGRLTFAKGGDAFIISNKTETEVLGSHELTMVVGIAMAAVCYFMALITFLMHLKQN